MLQKCLSLEWCSSICRVPQCLSAGPSGGEHSSEHCLSVSSRDPLRESVCVCVCFSTCCARGWWPCRRDTVPKTLCSIVLGAAQVREARYLVDNDPGLSAPMLALIGCGGLAGYTIFRAANSQKDQFRRDPSHPSVQHLQVMEVKNLQTGRQSNLLVSGWWGLARKINYTGDCMMAGA